MAKYPETFKHTSMMPDLFYKFYAQVCTRCFGWGLPSTSMIPMADNCNHSDVTVVQEILHKPSHLDAERGSKYFTKTKFMNDYSICFNEEEYKGDHLRTVNVKGRYSKANYDANKQFTSIPKLKDALSAGIQLWDVPCIRENYTEDNDTEEEEEDEEEVKSSAQALEMLSSMLTDRRATIKDLRKGFVFFMDQEKRDIKRHVAV